MYIKKGDTVIVTTGKDAKKTGTVLEILPKVNRVLVEGVNIIKKHQKPTQQNQAGSIIEKEAPIHASNVMLLDPKTNTPTRVGYMVNAEGKKVRVAKKSGTVLDQNSDQ